MYSVVPHAEETNLHGDARRGPRPRVLVLNFSYTLSFPLLVGEGPAGAGLGLGLEVRRLGAEPDVAVELDLRGFGRIIDSHCRTSALYHIH